MGNAAIQKQVLAIAALLALLCGCDGKKDEMATPVGIPAAAGLPDPNEVPASAAPVQHDRVIGEKVYRNTCSICHRLGLRGAPRLGDAKDWALRLTQGKEILYSRAINGYHGSKGSMPSRGSNAKLSETEVKAAVDYMVWYSVPESRGSLGSHLFSATAKQFTIR